MTTKEDSFSESHASGSENRHQDSDSLNDVETLLRASESFTGAFSSMTGMLVALRLQAARRSLEQWLVVEKTIEPAWKAQEASQRVSGLSEAVSRLDSFYRLLQGAL